VTLTPTAREQVEALAAARNADGGWGYGRGRASRLEPTSLALIALNAAGAPAGTQVLERWPRAAGLLIDPQTRMVNASDNAVALLAVEQRGLGPENGAAIARALGAVKGTALPPSPKSNRQDNALQGWPWVASTFSWVEPTAWCVLALKKWVRARDDRATAARVAEGERLLIDRVCRNGGWNYGNSNVLGKELFPYVPVTAIVLLALQDRRDEQAVKTSASYLASHCLDERSGLSLALASIALAVHGHDNSSVATALADTWRTTRYLGNVAAAALALYAEAGNAEHHAAFRLQ